MFQVLQQPVGKHRRRKVHLKVRYVCLQLRIGRDVQFLGQLVVRQRQRVREAGQGEAQERVLFSQAQQAAVFALHVGEDLFGQHRKADRQKRHPGLNAFRLSAVD